MNTCSKPQGPLKDLIQLLSEAVRLGEVKKITQQVKEHLEDFIRSGRLVLPEQCRVPLEENYARRLLHHDEESGFVVVAMAWAPGQGTSLHDHDGIWCVEGVVEGEMKVTYFDLVEKKKDLYRFRAAGETRAGVGGAGALIPPHEHHKLSNALENKTSVTVHVYGGEINHCSSFVPQDESWYRRETRKLTYHN